MAHKTQIKIPIEIDGTIVTQTMEVTEFDHTAQEIDDAVERINNIEETGESSAVLYTVQTLTNEQQIQARRNIGAVSVTEFTAALGEVDAALAGMDEVIG